MDPKILLINAPFKYQYSVRILPLGILILGTILKNSGLEVKVLDLSANVRFDRGTIPRVRTEADFIRDLKKFDPEIVGISSCTENYPFALKVAQMCKNENENIKIMLGGSHVSFQAAECLSANPSIDLIAIGETEHVILEIIKGLLGKLPYEAISNIAFRENNTIKLSDRITLPDLNNIPAPDLDLVEEPFYSDCSLHIEFSRGCSFNCCFCSLCSLSPKVRYFPINRTLEIIQNYMEKFQDFTFFITDPNFLLNPKLVLHFLEEVKKSTTELPKWNFQTRVDLIRKDLLKELKKMNAYQITLGIEDIHDSVLQAARKHITFNQIEKAVKIIKNLDFLSHSNFIIGLPTQTKSQALETIKYSSKLDRFNFSLLKPFPGTAIFTDPSKFGLSILSTQWENFTPYEIVMASATFEQEDQKEVRELAMKHYVKLQIERGFFDLISRREYRKVLEMTFEAWHELWKKNHFTGWN